jgi:signal transduction histidine kinase/CheY-like chemotaxis protein/HPt (histidine-containing phosphotransfer) domain-containing protein
LDGTTGGRRTTALSIRRWTLRRLLGTLLGVLGILVGGLFLIASMQLHASRAQTDAENRRAASFLIADGLRQSSNDLTNMVRLYVATGQPRYREYYQEILDVRAGHAPRPLNYDSSFWDRVLADGKGFVKYGKPQSLNEQMEAEHFAPDEFKALTTALNTSNVLAKLEQQVMKDVAPRIKRDVDAGYSQDVAAYYRQLVDGDYLLEKGRIMKAIRQFTQLVDARTELDVRKAADASARLAFVQIAIVGLIAIVGVLAMFLLSRVALRPLAKLLSSTRRIAAGDYGERVQITAVSDLEQLAGAFNEMGVAVETDIAARAEAEREAVQARNAAVQASQAKSTFLAAMTHELRTPMIGVTGMLEILAHTDLTRHQRSMVATAEGSARSLLDIIGDVLDFSKIEADKLELSPTTFDLRGVVAAAADTFIHTASAKGLLLTWDVDDRLAAAHVGDALRVRQIVTNLVSNAVKFTEVGGIEVHARLMAPRTADGVEQITVSVTDTGIGVTAEQQARLFEAFSQADASTTRQFGGTGLGLVICRRLALLMGGDITMQSTAGVGTTMQLEVPLTVGDPADCDPRGASFFGPFTGSRAKPTRTEAEAEGSLILLAEDHPVNRTVIVQQLDLVGFHVEVAEDGEEAFERFVSGNYGLVLTDLNMPRMDGYELALAIRRHERRQGLAPTPVIALSANVMQGEPERTRAVGMDDFMAKPTTIPFMAGKLRQWLPGLAWDAVPAHVDSGSDEGALDIAALDLLTGGDEARGRAVLDDFVATTRGDLEALRAAIVGQLVGDVHRSAHRIRGAALMVGARPMATLSQQVEDATAGDACPNWAALTALTDRLDDALAITAAMVEPGPVS